MKKWIAIAALLAGLVSCGLIPAGLLAAEQPSNLAVDNDANGTAVTVPHESRMVQGWTVHVSRELLENEPQLTEQALKLLEPQLEEIIRLVPASAVQELRRVPLYFSSEYPKTRPQAEYHPGAGWLRDHGRDPAMVKSVEFTNIRIFAAEVNRMPNFALHELAHAYHDRVLPKGFENPDVLAAYVRAKESGSYDKIERHNGNGRPNTFEKAYAMVNQMEYFAECSEAYFSRNDFYPFTRDELKRHDPVMFELLGRIWNEPEPQSKN